MYWIDLMNIEKEKIDSSEIRIEKSRKGHIQVSVNNISIQWLTSNGFSKKHRRWLINSF